MLPCLRFGIWNCFDDQETDYRFSVRFSTSVLNEPDPDPFLIFEDPTMRSTTSTSRSSSDQTTVRFEHPDASATKLTLPVPLSAADNSAANEPLAGLQHVMNDGAVTQAPGNPPATVPEHVRAAASNRRLNLSEENRALYERGVSPGKIYHYNELRLLGIPPDRIQLADRTNIPQQPQEGVKQTMRRGDVKNLALRMLHGADPNERDALGTPVIVSAAARGLLNEVRVLAGTRNCEINARDARQRTALVAASAAGHAEVVNALLAYLPDLDAADQNGMTALMYLCQRGQKETARLLLRAGANPDLRSAAGVTAREIAQRHGHHDILNEPAPVASNQGNIGNDAMDVSTQ
jgi:hypothetical protein